MDFGAAGPGLTLLGTFGGAWLILRLIRWFQKDFAEEYRAELAAVRKELELETEKRKIADSARQSAEERAGRYRYLLIVNGIDPEGEPHAH